MSPQFQYGQNITYHIAVTIIAQPYDGTNDSRHTADSESNDLNIILGVLLGILATLCCICMIYSIRFYRTRKNERNARRREVAHNMHQEGETPLKMETE